MPTRREKALLLHIVDYLNKPISRQELLAAIERVPSPINRILLVDDDPGFLRLLTRILRSTQRSYTLDRAYNGTEALAHMCRHKPDLVILDLIMPGMDGVQVTEQMHRDPALADIPVLIITAKSVLEQEHAAPISLLATSLGGLTPTEMVRGVHAMLDSMVGSTRDSTQNPAASLTAPLTAAAA